uniref:Uncharacterized protein n=1 Tax=Oryza meridionalis TaxID=40149 RepID=A0A0E0ERR2_9ORYZ
MAKSHQDARGKPRMTMRGFFKHGSKRALFYDYMSNDSLLDFASMRALFYEYMSNGSLEKCSVGNSPSEENLNWGMLFDIVVGTARGLE